MGRSHARLALDRKLASQISSLDPKLKLQRPLVPARREAARTAHSHFPIKMAQGASLYQLRRCFLIRRHRLRPLREETSVRSVVKSFRRFLGRSAKRRLVAGGRREVVQFKT